MTAYLHYYLYKIIIIYIYIYIGISPASGRFTPNYLVPRGQIASNPRHRVSCIETNPLNEWAFNQS